jgi:hypothetical protein
MVAREGRVLEVCRFVLPIVWLAAAAGSACKMVDGRGTDR